MKKLIFRLKYKVFVKNCLWCISLLIVIISFFSLGVLIGIDYQRYSYEQPNSTNWILLETLPEDLVINFTAHISEINLTYTIPFTVNYNNSLLEIIVEGYLNRNVSFIEVSFKTNDTLMHFIFEQTSFYTYSFYTWFISLYNDDSVILAECRLFYIVQFFRSVI